LRSTRLTESEYRRIDRWHATRDHALTGLLAEGACDQHERTKRAEMLANEAASHANAAHGPLKETDDV
jgi:hypothetical protein